MDLSALADFNAVATNGGFSAASRATGTPKASLSRRVRELEVELGVRLLERGTRSLRLTEEGQLLRNRTIHLLDDLTQAGEEISGHAGRPRGLLKISAPGLFAHTALGRIAADFIAAYPDVTLDIKVDDRFVDPVADEVDVVIRVNPQATTDLVGQCFLKDHLVVAAHPAIAIPGAQGGVVPAVVLAAAGNTALWKIQTGDTHMLLQPRPVLRCSSMLLVRDAVLAGAGAAMLPRWLAEPEFASGALTCWGTAVDRTVEAWALHASRRLQSPKVKAFMAVLLAAYAGQPVKK